MTTWAGGLLLAMALAMLAPPGAQANICDEETPGSSGAAYDRLLPLWDFTKSYQFYQQARNQAARDALQTQLRYFVEYNAQVIHERHLEYARAQAFDPGFIALYEDALAWGRDLCEPGGETAYAEHLVYLARGDEPSQRLARSLFLQAASLEHPLAAYDLALERLADDSGSVRRNGVSALHASAKSGHVPAQLALADLYERGHVAPLDRARAYYWYVRAQRAGADVENRLVSLMATILPAERAQADTWLSSGAVPWSK